MTHKETREQSQKLLLLAGIRLFGTKGYDATSIVDIETERHHTRGDLTYHYKSKLGFFEATVDRWNASPVQQHLPVNFNPIRYDLYET